MNLKLIKLTPEYKDALIEMIEEWTYDQRVNHTNLSPRTIFRNDCHDFDHYLANLERKDESDGLVPDSVFFCLDVDRNRLVGAADIRHYLNDDLLLGGGHIGDGIRPSERRKGYATAMVGLALEECRKLGIKKVLMCCAKDNVGSKKSIQRNGGVFENEVWDEGVLTERYWIDLENPNTGSPADAN